MSTNINNANTFLSDKMDRRIVKTKRAIHRAFLGLIASKSYKEITVKDLAETAGVNRKTFYNHYKDIKELIDEIETEVVHSFDVAMAGIDVHETLQDPELLCSRLLKIVERTQDMCENIMRIQYDGNFVNKIADALENSVRRNSRDEINLDDSTVSFLMKFAVAGMLQTYQTWYNSDRQESIEEVTRRISWTIANGVNGLTSVQK